MTKTSEIRWECKDFIYRRWASPDVWAGLSPDDKDTASLAQLTSWQTHQAEITNELRRWQEQGWQALGEPGPASIRLRKSIRIDSRIAPSDIFLWFMTLGIALILQLVLDTPRRYAIYKPVEFRLPMRQLRTPETANGANAVVYPGILPVPDVPCLNVHDRPQTHFETSR